MRFLAMFGKKCQKLRGPTAARFNSFHGRGIQKSTPIGSDKIDSKFDTYRCRLFKIRHLQVSTYTRHLQVSTIQNSTPRRVDKIDSKFDTCRCRLFKNRHLQVQIKLIQNSQPIGVDFSKFDTYRCRLLKNRHLETFHKQKY